MRRIAFIAPLLLPLTIVHAELVALEDQGLDTVSGQAGLTLSNLDWTLNYDKSSTDPDHNKRRRGCLDAPTNQLCNSIPLQIDGTSRYLVLYNATGRVQAHKINIDLVNTPPSIRGSATADVPAIQVSFPDSVDLTYTDWRIDKISVSDSDILQPGAAPSPATYTDPDTGIVTDLPGGTGGYNQNGKIIHFETNAKWSFGPNTTAYFFKTP